MEDCYADHIPALGSERARDRHSLVEGDIEVGLDDRNHLGVEVVGCCSLEHRDSRLDVVVASNLVVEDMGFADRNHLVVGYILLAVDYILLAAGHSLHVDHRRHRRRNLVLTSRWTFDDEADEVFML
jgi:hypothetical protein